ncbi:MAG: TRAP transporter substrate-binding protein [Verrucomicrobia bacterium]|nr:TRAP transporter substrate-binding protein [Verrucomicrobiota bacterium]
MAKSFFRIGAGLLAATLGGCGRSPERAAGSAAKPGPTEIRFAHAHAPDLTGELHYSAVTFAEAVAALTDRLTVRIFPQGTLGSEREVYEGMQLGSGAAITVSGTAILNNFDQRIGVLDLPYLWKDYDHVHRVLDGEVGRDLAAGLEKQGLIVLAWIDGWGYRNMITTSKPVKRPADLKGLKIRTIPTPVYLATLRMLGTNPTPMAYGEIYTGLQTGVIDGFEQGPAIVVAEKFYEIAKHMTITRHLLPTLVICYSQAQWARLSPDDQARLRQAGRVAQEKERALAPTRETEGLKTLRERGMTMHEIDTSGWRQAAITVQDQLAAERGATDLLEKIRRAAQQ